MLSSAGYQADKMEMIKYLIESKADVNARDNDGDTIIEHLLGINGRNEQDILVYLLSSTEIQLPKENIKFGKPYNWVITCRLIQAVCSCHILLEDVLDRTISESETSGQQLIVHSDPRFFVRDSTQQDQGLAKRGDRNKYMSEHREVCSLETWSIYHLRRHLLEVRGNKSILLRLNQLSLPPPFLSRVTLECFSHQPPGYDSGDNDNMIYISDLSDCTDDSDDSLTLMTIMFMVLTTSIGPRYIIIDSLYTNVYLGYIGPKMNMMANTRPSVHLQQCLLSTLFLNNINTSVVQIGKIPTNIY